jgi:hypothetical protein
MIQPGGRDLAALQCGDQRIGVVQLGPRGIEEHHAAAHLCELRGADHADGIDGDQCVQRDDVGLLEQLIEGVLRLVAIRVNKR